MFLRREIGLKRSPTILAALLLLLLCSRVNDYLRGLEEAAALEVPQTIMLPPVELPIEAPILVEPQPTTTFITTRPSSDASDLFDPPFQTHGSFGPIPSMLDPQPSFAHRYDWFLGPILQHERLNYRVYLTDLSTPSWRSGSSDKGVAETPPKTPTVTLPPEFNPPNDGEGVGGVPIPPTSIPEPMLLPLMLLMALRFGRPCRQRPAAE